MSASEKCWVAGCERGAAASVTREDLPGPLRLCYTHTEQFRQSSEGWGIAWPPGEPTPASVTAPGPEVLWAYKPGGGHSPDPVVPTDASRQGLPGRAAGWIEARRAAKRDRPK